MVDTIKVNPISSQLSALPDINEVGGIFKGLTQAGKALQGVVQGGINTELDTLQNTLRNAQSLDQTAGINTDDLIRAGADANQLTAAENAIAGRKGTLFGDQTIADYESKLASNRAIAESVLKNNADAIGGNVSLGKGGSFLFSKPSGSTPEELAASEKSITEAKRVFQEGLKAGGFQEYSTERERADYLRKEGRKLGLSDKQIAGIDKRFNDYKANVEKMTPEEQAILAQQNTQIDRQLDTARLNLQQAQQNVQNTLRYSPEQADKVLQTKWSQVWNFADEKTGEELGFTDIFRIWRGQKSGIDVKEMISEDFKNNKTKAGNAIEPWMVLLAMEETVDSAKGEQNIDEDAFEKSLIGIADNEDNQYRTRLQTASQMGTRFAQANLNIEDQAAALKSEQARLLKDASGIRDTQRNTAFFNTDLGSPTPVAAPQNQGNSILPGVGTPTTQPQQNIVDAVRTGTAAYGNTPQGFPLATSLAERSSGTGQINVQPGGAINFKAKDVFEMTPVEVGQLNTNAIKQTMTTQDLDKIKDPETRAAVERALNSSDSINRAYADSANDLKNFLGSVGTSIFNIGEDPNRPGPDFSNEISDFNARQKSIYGNQGIQENIFRDPANYPAIKRSLNAEINKAKLTGSNTGTLAQMELKIVNALELGKTRTEILDALKGSKTDPTLLKELLDKYGIK